jgi:hypothetical protein
MLGDYLNKTNNYYYNNYNLPPFSPFSEISSVFATPIFGRFKKALALPHSISESGENGG